MNFDPSSRTECLLRSALALALAVSPISGFAASFDCSHAQEPDEKVICTSRQLSELDIEMSVRYQMLLGLVAMGTRGTMQDEQQAWINIRKKCRANQACLVAAYRHRIEMLNAEYARLASRGPF